MIHNEDKSVSLIGSIMVNDSSELSDTDPFLFHLDDTKHAIHRRETQRVVLQELERSLESIKSAVHSRSGHNVSALEAVHHGQAQHSPPSEYRKRKLLGEAMDYTTGQHDDDINFIVFDCNNGLLATDTICAV